MLRNPVPGNKVNYFAHTYLHYETTVWMSLIFRSQIVKTNLQFHLDPGNRCLPPVLQCVNRHLQRYEIHRRAENSRCLDRCHNLPAFFNRHETWFQQDQQSFCHPLQSLQMSPDSPLVTASPNMCYSLTRYWLSNKESVCIWHQLMMPVIFLQRFE